MAEPGSAEWNLATCGALLSRRSISSGRVGEFTAGVSQPAEHLVENIRLGADRHADMVCRSEVGARRGGYAISLEQDMGDLPGVAAEPAHIKKQERSAGR